MFNFNYFDLTLEQHTPTNITLIKLHDLVITINGKLTKYIAYVCVIPDNHIKNAGIILFFTGILTLALLNVK